MTANILNNPRFDIQVRVLCYLSAIFVWPSVLIAQDLSYDGKRWLEVELSVFTNEYPETEYSEQPVAKNLSLQYLPKLQKLLTPISSLMIEFPEPISPTAVPATEIANAAPTVEAPVVRGPLYSLAVRDSFKVNDYARDAFITLVDRIAKFNSINRNLTDSSEHRVLSHQVWRQPLQPRAQTPAIFVAGGEYIDNHAELEGSLRLSDINGRATLDINLWLNRFGNTGDIAESEWKVPELPLPLKEMADDPALVAADLKPIIEVWQMQQTRELGANEIYYLDHPAFGVLIQLRPYLLPEQAVVTDEGDF